MLPMRAPAAERMMGRSTAHPTAPDREEPMVKRILIALAAAFVAAGLAGV